MQQVLGSLYFYDYKVVTKIGCLYISLPVQKQVLTNSIYMKFLSGIMGGVIVNYVK
jgi:hypothetical protein